MWAYRNPVNIIFGEGAFDEIPALLNGRSYALVSYPDGFSADLCRRLARLVGEPLAIIDDVAPNPEFRILAGQVARMADSGAQPEAIVAVGGGSVIDTAKVLAAANNDFDAVRHFLQTKSGGERLGAIPIIAVPTTAGTGSEVTCWGTVWDGERSVKHSLELPGLFPEAAVVDPRLMLTKPRDLTISTGLDALSHALESLWNKNANPVSKEFAVAAARDIFEVLPKLIDDPGNLTLRSRMARASLFAGLAFSNTKTAIAHSLSYPITLRHGVPHGIACSFTLPMVLRSVESSDGICGEGLAAIFDGDPGEGANRLSRLLTFLRVSTLPADYGISASEWQDLVDAAFNGERGQNFIGSRDMFLPSSAAEGRSAFPHLGQ